MLPALLVAMPLGVMASAAALTSLRAREERGRFLQRHRQQVFLLWDTRGGWHRFLVNNVLPVLPPEVLPCPRGGRRAARPGELGVWRALGSWRWRSLPALAMFHDGEVRTVSLHAALSSLAARRRRSPAVQAEVRARLAPFLAALPRSGERAVGGRLTSAAAPLTFAGGG